jgi:hypothetical protein
MSFSALSLSREELVIKFLPNFNHCLPATSTSMINLDGNQSIPGTVEVMDGRDGYGLGSCMNDLASANGFLY